MISKLVVYPFWALTILGNLALTIAGIIRVIAIYNDPNPDADPTTSNGADQIIATFVVLLAFITLVVHCVEFGFFLRNKLPSKMFFIIELVKTMLIAPAWALFMWRIVHVLVNGPAIIMLVVGSFFTYVDECSQRTCKRR